MDGIFAHVLLKCRLPTGSTKKKANLIMQTVFCQGLVENVLQRKPQNSGAPNAKIRTNCTAKMAENVRENGASNMIIESGPNIKLKHLENDSNEI